MTEVEFFFDSRLGDPQNWIYFYSAIIFTGFMGVALWRRKRAIESMVHERNESLLLNDLPKRKRWFSLIVMTLALLLISFSLLNPKWGFHWEEIQRKGVDIMVAVDVSQSMLAADSEPNRLISAKRKILDLLDIIEGDRIGLIAFAGTSYLQCPLTLDYGAFRIFLDLIDTDLIPQQGTAIDEAILMAIEAFSQSAQKSRALILITDGEEHSGAYLDAAKQASRMGVKIYTLGFGSPEGHPIPDKQGLGNLRDAQGNIVISRLNEEILQQIALESGGAYVRSQTGDDDLKQIYEGEILKKLEAQNLKSSRQRRYEPRFQWFLLFGFLLLLADVMIRHIPKPRHGDIARFLPLIFLLTIGNTDANLLERFGFKGLAEARVAEGKEAYQAEDFQKASQLFQQAELENPGDIKAIYNQANALYKAGDFQGAVQLYESLKEAPESSISCSATYNLGNSFYRLGQLEQSIQAYEATLQKQPHHENAKNNLEFVRQKLREMAEKNQDNQSNQNSQQENQSNQNNQKNEQGQNQQNQQGASDDSKETGQKSDQEQNQASQKQQDNSNQGQSSDQKQPQSDETDKSEQNQKQASKEANDQSKPKEGQQSEAEDPSKDQSDQEGASTNSSSMAAKPVRLTKEEAQKFLNRLQQNHKKQMKEFVRYKLGNKGVRGSKEW